MAVDYGADAVYLAGTSFGMRSFAGNFSPEELPKAVAYCPRPRREGPLSPSIPCPATTEAAAPAGLSRAAGRGRRRCPDPGGPWRIYAGREVCPPLRAPRLHPAVHRQLRLRPRRGIDLGAQRVVLARELSLEEIREIRPKHARRSWSWRPSAHGAMCVSYSGRCLLSNYMTGRDSNRGACAQPCRYQYALMEEKRPGEYFPVVRGRKGDLHPQLPGYVHDRPSGRC